MKDYWAKFCWAIFFLLGLLSAVAPSIVRFEKHIGFLKPSFPDLSLNKGFGDAEKIPLQDQVTIQTDVNKAVQIVLRVNTEITVEETLQVVAVEVLRWASEQEGWFGVAVTDVSEDGQELLVGMSEPDNMLKLNGHMKKMYPHLHLRPLKKRKGNAGMLHYGFSEEYKDQIRQLEIEHAKQALLSRLKAFDLENALITELLKDTFLIQVPQTDSVEALKILLKRSGLLQIRLVDNFSDNFPEHMKDLAEGMHYVDKERSNREFYTQRRQDIEDRLTPFLNPVQVIYFKRERMEEMPEVRWRSYVLLDEVLLSQNDIKNAVVSKGRSKADITTEFLLTDAGSKKFAKIMDEKFSSEAALVIDGLVETSVQPSGKVRSDAFGLYLEGDFTAQERAFRQKALAVAFSAGSVKAKIEIMEGSVFDKWQCPKMKDEFCLKK